VKELKMWKWLGLVFVVSCGAPMAQPVPGSNVDMATSDRDAAARDGRFSGSCCLNGAFYACDSEAAFQACAGFDLGKCHDECAFDDFDCHIKCDEKAASASHDPSMCQRDSKKDGDCEVASSCSGSWNGQECNYSTQCPNDYHCTDGKCYPAKTGNPCDYSTECDSGNCTNNCCQGRTKGSACTYSTQCDSGNCTNNRCQ
jgi:hypothetical protein